ncbi:nitroreductase family deazaflavin-dependent oxidoreductase [Ktedonosporobacter rubrisoli]|uniref:Nitroreductase family deazaflavin-dependent oxidoreductase n=1 Tax=Ktedonosporobacter rubrisoli TaxID=2509675 RepID=A0A4P6K2R2_KTERU|nr:nitroreductase/quinone reductase family protein [Ktedonosporobacter rubrisoli]QBD82518.1 nitroreductase family deazaflavin-dependent oxidoreductase [Ktedonosporobacter rubrisoli]
MSDWNKAITEEFRANEGKVGGMYKGAALLLLTTIGRKSGKPYTVPLGYQTDAERLIIIAGNTNPDWYHNILAHPQVKIELGKESFEAIASPIEGEQKDFFLQRAHQNMKAVAQRSEDYAKVYAELADNFSKNVPVVALQRVER